MISVHPDLVRLGSASPRLLTFKARMTEDVVRERVSTLLVPRGGAKIPKNGFASAASDYAL